MRFKCVSNPVQVKIFDLLSKDDSDGIDAYNRFIARSDIKVLSENSDNYVPPPKVIVVDDDGEEHTGKGEDFWYVKISYILKI